MSKPTNEQHRSLTAQLLVGVIGLILSIVLHEAFHIYMHWGHITHVELFPNLTTIVQIDTALPPGYDIQGEEVVAYGITLLVAIITAMIIFKIRDTDDPRSTGQMLFPKDKDLQKMTPAEMLKLSGLDELNRTPKKSTNPSATKK